MSKVILDVRRCQPQKCAEGICIAYRKCPVKALWQEEPYTVPFLSEAQCNGCSKCLAACSLKAIYLSQPDRRFWVLTEQR